MLCQQIGTGTARGICHLVHFTHEIAQKKKL